MALPERHKMLARWGELKRERATWLPYWRDLSRFVQPVMGRFLVTDVNKGGDRYNTIYDNTGTRAHGILSAGLMAGMTSPARPWFRLTTSDPMIADSHDVKVWLSDVRSLMLEVYGRNNTYRALQMIYEELGLFGTAANLVLPNFERVQHNYGFTAGEYALACDYEGTVNACYREVKMRVGAIVTEFGRDNCSSTIRNMFDRGMLDATVTITHAIEPRAERDPTSPEARNMPFASCYFEQGAPPGKYLREGGFKRQRVLAPRWRVNGGGDVYGTSPAMVALGDIKQLQHEQLRKGQGIDYMTKPPIGLPTGMMGKETDLLPGGVTYFDQTAPGGAAGSRAMFEANLNLSHLLADIQDVRQRINGAFFADLFLMVSQIDTTGRTATEIAERKEEKLLMLGPVLERLHNELLDPMVKMTFEDLLEAGALPPPPPAMHGATLQVEFVSTLAQAQRAIGSATTDRFVSNLGVVAGFKAEVLDKFDADKWADISADQLGVDPELIVASDKVVLIREARAKAQQQAEATAQAGAMADAAHKLGNAPTRGGASNALDDVLGNFMGYNSPGAENY